MQDYIVEKELGRGSFGIVYKAVSRKDGNVVALKSVNAIRRDVTLKEFEILRKLNNPNIVKYYRLIEEPDRTWLVMEYVEGISLQEYMKETFPSPTPPQYVMKLAKLFLTTLEYLAKEKIAHRDIKPSNIMYDPARCRFVLVDFGTVCLVEECFRSAGTPKYMSPEMFLLSRNLIRPSDVTKEAYFLSDVWSLGVCLLFLSQGKDHTPEHYGRFIKRKREGKLDKLLNLLKDPIIYYNIISEDEKLQKLLRAMLTLNYKEDRPSASQCLAKFF